MSRIVVPKHTEGLLHPYGLVVDKDYVYVTVQDTNSMLRFNVDNGEAAPYPLALHEKAHNHHHTPFSPGTFIQFDNQVNSVRGVAIDEQRGRLWVANKDLGLLVFKRDGGHLEVSHAASQSMASLAVESVLLTMFSFSTVVTVDAGDT